VRRAILASRIVISLMDISVYSVHVPPRIQILLFPATLTIHTKKMYFSAISYMAKFSRVKYEYALLASK